MAVDRLAYNRAGQLFMGANTAAATMSTVSTTATGLILYNPVGSNKSIYLLDYGFAWTTVPGAIHKIGLALMAPNVIAASSVTAAGSGILNNFGNQGTAQGRVYSSATLPVAPVSCRWSAGAAWITGGTGESPYSFIDYVEGAICVAPGAALQITGDTTAPVGLGHFTWIEV